MPSDFPKEKYVYLQAISSGFNTHKRIPVTTVNGFLFIQTDKPLYTPDQEGQYHSFISECVSFFVKFVPIKLKTKTFDGECLSSYWDL